MINAFQIIDLDRTLFDTQLFVRSIGDELDLLEPGWGTELYNKFTTAYNHGETFYIMRLLRQQKGDAWFDNLVDQAVSRAGLSNLVMPFLQERIEAAATITSHRPAWGIMTYGNEIDQRLKCSLIGLDNANIPFLISPTPNKSSVISSWQNSDGSFTLPENFGGGVADVITLEDDKLEAFANMPTTGMYGYWLTDNRSDSYSGGARPSDNSDSNSANVNHHHQSSNNNNNVTAVDNLHDSLTAIRHNLSLLS